MQGDGAFELARSAARLFFPQQGLRKVEMSHLEVERGSELHGIAEVGNGLLAAALHEITNAQEELRVRRFRIGIGGCDKTGNGRIESTLPVFLHSVPEPCIG